MREERGERDVLVIASLKNASLHPDLNYNGMSEVFFLSHELS